MTIRSARPEDAGHIAKTILRSMRGYRPRGWFVAFGPLLAGSGRRALATMGVPAPAR